MDLIQVTLMRILLTGYSKSCEVLDFYPIIMNHVNISPTDGNGPTQGQRKTLNRVGIEPTTFRLDLRRSTD